VCSFSSRIEAMTSTVQAPKIVILEDLCKGCGICVDAIFRSTSAAHGRLSNTFGYLGWRA
jgi:Pyruvate/2-oxoacid:ferredoxin oxidoreductase delta subunit